MYLRCHIRNCGPRADLTASLVQEHYLIDILVEATLPGWWSQGRTLHQLGGECILLATFAHSRSQGHVSNLTECLLLESFGACPSSIGCSAQSEGCCSRSGANSHTCAALVACDARFAAEVLKSRSLVSPQRSHNGNPAPDLRAAKGIASGICRRDFVRLPRLGEHGNWPRP